MPDDGILTRYYRANLGEPDDTDEIYGYWAVFLGGLLGILGVLAFVGVELVPGENFFYRQFTIVGVMLALPAVGVGVALLLPLRRLAVWLVGVGLGACVLAAAGLVYYYPAQFNVVGGPDMAPAIIVAYLAGLLVQWSTIVIAPLVTSGGAEPVTASAPGGKGRY